MRPNFQSIVVSAPYDDLEMKASVENLCVQKISNVNLKVYRAIDILPPLKTYTQGEISDILASRNIEALLTVAIADFWREYYSTPGKTVSETQSTFQSTSDVQQWGNLFSVSTQGSGSSTTTSQYIPGMTFSRASVKLDARVTKIDISMKPEMIWRANSTTSGDYLTSTSKVLSDAVQEISNKLVADGIILGGPSELPFEARVVGGELSEVELGCISCPEWSQESVFNKYGTYGQRADQSIWDPNNKFGDITSEFCPCNPNGTQPPIIVNQYGEQIGFLSLNPNYPIDYKSRKLQKWLETKLCAESKE